MTTLLAHTRPSGPDPDWPTHPPFPPTGPQATYPGQPVPSGPNPNDPPPRPQFGGAW